MIDTLAQAGKRSLKITPDSTSKSFGGVGYFIPAYYAGDKVELEGYIKVKDVTDGFAGLLLRVDGKSGPLVFDNMKNKNVTGIKDWQKYTITLDCPQNGKNIVVGTLFT